LHGAKVRLLIFAKRHILVLNIYLNKKLLVKKAFLLPIVLFLFYYIQAQTVRTPFTSPYTQVGTYSINHTDAFSFISNQAALANINNFTAGVYGERRFMLEALSMYNAAIVVPAGSGNFGIKGGYFGNTAYNESQAGLGYGRKLGKKLDIGVQFNYYNVQISGYDNASAINAEGGLIYHLTPQIHIGVHAYNPTSVALGKTEEEKLAAIYNAGIGYEASDKFFISAEVEKIDDMPLNVNAGLQYKFSDVLLARGGVATRTSTVFFGLGMHLKNLRLDATASVHPQLGVTPGLLLIYNSKK
jgi:hypothetical protein